MRVTLEDLRLHPAEVSIAAQAGTVEVVDVNGDVRFRLSIPSEPLDGCEQCAEMRAEVARLTKHTDLGIAVADARRLRAERDQLTADLNLSRMEEHRLRTIVQAVDLHHIRLRDGLRRAIGWLDERVPDADREELRKLVQP